jgi:hypothetical protein
MFPLICLFVKLLNLIPCPLSITIALCFNLLLSQTILQTFNGWSLKVMWVCTREHYQYSNMDSMYGVIGSLDLRSTWMLTLEKEIVATCIAKMLVVSCNKFFLMFFSQGTRPKPKHRALILFGLFLMWTFRFNFEFSIFTFIVAICFLHWLFFVYGVLERCFEGRCLGMAKHATNWKKQTREK